MMNLIKKLRQYYSYIINYRLVNIINLHETWEQKQLKKTLKFYDVDCVLDVGANYGQYATMLRNKIGYKGLIISFEPLPDAAEKLRDLSRHDPLWIIMECALSDENGDTTFNIMAESQFSSLSKPSDKDVELFSDMNKISQTVCVKTQTLDFAFDKLKEEHKFKRPFLKMDTQGFDVKVITHGKTIIKDLIGIQSELAVKKIYTDSVDFREAITVYEKLGFTLSAFVPNNAGHFPRLIEIDCIMIRNELL